MLSRTVATSIISVGYEGSLTEIAILYPRYIQQGKLRLWPLPTILSGVGATSVLSVGYEGSPTIIATLYPRYIHNNCYCSTWSKVGSTNEKPK